MSLCIFICAAGLAELSSHAKGQNKTPTSDSFCPVNTEILSRLDRLMKSSAVSCLVG